MTRVYVRNFKGSSLSGTYIVMMITDGAGDMAGPGCDRLYTGLNLLPPTQKALFF